jgi:16S rRNA (cytosine1402-N4)-methyltransferase
MHIPVLYTESIDALNIQPDGVYVDGTLGGAGHASGIAEKLSMDGTLIGLDVDSHAIERATQKLAKYPGHIKLFRENFRNLSQVLDAENITAVDGVLLDLGWSSFQVDDAERGFSFQSDGPLVMTLWDNPDASMVTAADIINTWSEETLADIFYAYGDETAARLIAKKIVAARRDAKFTTTGELADFIAHVIPFRKGRTHPATRVFQALRIAVNDEYGALQQTLQDIVRYLRPGGRLAIITFHSGEDRIVKNTFKTWQDAGLGTVTTKKPITPTDEELAHNPRCRSAKLRIFEKL